MPRPASNRRKYGRMPLLLGLAVFCLLPVGGVLGQSPAGRPPTVATSAPSKEAAAKDDLERQKLAQEVLQLKNANGSHVVVWDRIMSLAPLVTVLVAVAGVLTTLLKMGFDNKQASAQARKQAETEQEQRKEERTLREAESLRWQAEQQAERQRQLEESFGAALANLRGDDDAGKAGAVVSLMTFLKPEYAAFHEQVYLVLRAMLKLMYTPPGQDAACGAVEPLFVRAFEKSLRAFPAASPLLMDIDFSRMFLDRANLGGLSLYRADLGFCAMRGADLTGSSLFRVRGFKVQWEDACLSRARLGEARLKFANCRGANFQGAWLVAAVLKGADLTNADFRGASLQSAHFEKANLEGANFRGADLRDAYFRGASLDDSAVRSLGGAKSWREAHFAPEIAALLGQTSTAAKLQQEKTAQENQENRVQEQIAPKSAEKAIP